MFFINFSNISSFYDQYTQETVSSSIVVGLLELGDFYVIVPPKIFIREF
jgi:hypothetical protein